MMFKVWIIKEKGALTPFFYVKSHLAKIKLLSIKVPMDNRHSKEIKRP